MEQNLRILVIDDDEVDRMTVRRALTKAGNQITFYEASNYEEAIAELENNQFDCIFLDYRLPGKDGLALVQELRESGSKIPIVVLTGQGDEQIAVELMKAGASDYLSKGTITPETLSKTLHNGIRICKAELQIEKFNQQLRKSNEELRYKNKQLEEKQVQIHLQNLKLLEASELKSRFLATVSHELRTPLNAIITFSQMLLRKTKSKLTAKEFDMMERVLNNGRNLLLLINDILDISKIEAGSLQLNIDKFNLPHLVNLTVEELHSLAEQKSLQIKVNNNLKNPQIFNDQVRLRQILTNLLSNAIKFTDFGSIIIELNEIYLDKIVIIVTDTGIGIPSEELEYIFEPFRQVNQTISRKHPGTGLGLAITKSLTTMMGGTITVKSELDKGSIFRVEFPYHIHIEREKSE